MDRKALLNIAFVGALTAVSAAGVPADQAQITLNSSVAIDLAAISKASRTMDVQAVASPIIQDILKKGGSVSESWINLAFSKAA